MAAVPVNMLTPGPRSLPAACPRRCLDTRRRAASQAGQGRDDPGPPRAHLRRSRRACRRSVVCALHQPDRRRVTGPWWLCRHSLCDPSVIAASTFGAATISRFRTLAAGPWGSPSGARRATHGRGPSCRMPAFERRTATGSSPGPTAPRSRRRATRFQQRRTSARTDDTLTDLLGAGRIDAFIAPLEPKALYEKNTPFVRLFDDFPSAERAYFQRTGIFPGHHVVCVKRSFFDAHPDVTWAIYLGLEESKLSFDENAKLFGQSSPWLLRDLRPRKNSWGKIGGLMA